MPGRARRALIAAVVWLAALAGPQTGTAAAEGAEHLWSFTWSHDDPAFGGLSGIHVGDGGRSLIAISDRGSIVTGRLERAEDGRITGVAEAEIRPLLDPEGRALEKRFTDAEGIAVDAGGRIHISFEARHRVWSYAAPGAAAEPLPQHPGFARFRFNAGMEALALDPQGRLVALPERSGETGLAFPVYRWNGEDWERPFDLPRNGSWLPAGADFGPDGRLYILERDFRGLLGFRSRLSRFVIGPEGPGPREVLFATRGPWHDNLEGVSVWRDAAGALRATLVSDDNFFRLQRTEIVEYRLAD